MEKIIESRPCKHCWASFDITDKDLEFYDKISPVFSWKKYLIPSPTFCPECRQQRRLSFRNERKLYKRKCDLTGKEIISIYAPDTSYKVYDWKARYSDQWNPMEYGQTFDDTKSFFLQFHELLKKVPRLSLYRDDMCHNCDYCNQITACKDCYLMISGSESEHCLYGKRIVNSEYCVDCLFGIKSKYCYQCIDIFECYHCFFVQNAINCSDSYFLYNCQWCSFCVFCTNLRNESYCIFNKKYSKEEYFEKLKEILDMHDIQHMKEIFSDIKTKAVRRAMDIDHGENVLWDNIQYAKNVSYSFDCSNIEDSKFCQFVQDTKTVYDADYCCCESAHCYEIATGWIDMYNCLFGIDIRPNINNALYCDSCNSWSNNIFWCVWLRKKSYCILNKQYTKSEYEKEVGRIIWRMVETGERWEFFPASLSPFGYNETVAMESFPLNKNEAIEKWFRRSDYEAPFPKTDAKDIIICEVSGKPFRLIPQEIEFYKKHNLPLPTKHPDIRHAERMALRNPRKLRDRKCAKCGADIKTSYSPERKEIVYCEQCYNKEIYW